MNCFFLFISSDNKQEVAGISTLSSEVLAEIFKYIEDSHKTLFSCILVNKEWHNINIPILWRDPFYSAGSIRVLINCLLVTDKDFLTRNNIKLSFELLDRLPLYNYAKFTTTLRLLYYINKNLKIMVDSYKYDKIDHFRKDLVDF